MGDYNQQYTELFHHKPLLDRPISESTKLKKQLISFLTTEDDFSDYDLLSIAHSLLSSELYPGESILLSHEEVFNNNTLDPLNNITQEKYVFY